MRWTSSFNKGFVVSSFISLACHGAAVMVAVWVSPFSSSSLPKRPRFQSGEYAIRIVLLPKTSELEVATTDIVVEESEEEQEDTSREETRAADDHALRNVDRTPKPALDPPSLEDVPEEEQLTKTDEPRPTAKKEKETESVSKATPGNELAAKRQPTEKKPQPVKDEPPPEGKPGVREGAQLLGRPAPHYPRSCRRRSHEGTVLLECRLNALGRVLSVRVLSSSGCDKLDRSALEAMRSATFRSARVNGKPVASTITLPVTFQLR